MRALITKSANSGTHRTRCDTMQYESIDLVHRVLSTSNINEQTETQAHTNASNNLVNETSFKINSLGQYHINQSINFNLKPPYTHITLLSLSLSRSVSITFNFRIVHRFNEYKLIFYLAVTKWLWQSFSLAEPIVVQYEPICQPSTNFRHHDIGFDKMCVAFHLNNKPHVRFIWTARWKNPMTDDCCENWGWLKSMYVVKYTNQKQMHWHISTPI